MPRFFGPSAVSLLGDWGGQGSLGRHLNRCFATVQPLRPSGRTKSHQIAPTLSQGDTVLTARARHRGYAETWAKDGIAATSSHPEWLRWRGPVRLAASVMKARLSASSRSACSAACPG